LEIRNEIYKAQNYLSSRIVGIDAIFSSICEEIIKGLRFIFEKCATKGKKTCSGK
jgi:hypothetical protein